MDLHNKSMHPSIRGVGYESRLFRALSLLKSTQNRKVPLSLNQWRWSCPFSLGRFYNFLFIRCLILGFCKTPSSLGPHGTALNGSVSRCRAEVSYRVLQPLYDQDGRLISGENLDGRSVILSQYCEYLADSLTYSCQSPAFCKEASLRAMWREIWEFWNFLALNFTAET